MFSSASGLKGTQINVTNSGVFVACVWNFVPDYGLLENSAVSPRQFDRVVNKPHQRAQSLLTTLTTVAAPWGGYKTAKAQIFPYYESAEKPLRKRSRNQVPATTFYETTDWTLHDPWLCQKTAKTRTRLFRSGWCCFFGPSLLPSDEVGTAFAIGLPK